MTLGERHKIRHPRHGAVLIHDLADHGCRVEPGETRKIDRGFRMPRTDENASLARDQREHVPRRDDVVMIFGRIDRRRDRACTVVRGNAGGDAFARLDRHGERGAGPGGIGPHHRFQPELLRPGFRQCEADQAAAVLGHEVDGIGRRHLRRDDEIAFVLAVLGVDQNDHAAVAQVIQQLRRGGEDALPLRVLDGIEGLVHRRNSKRRAT